LALSHPRQPNRDVCRVHKLNVNKREIHLVEVKYYLHNSCGDTRLDTNQRPLQNDEVLCKRLKAKEVILHTILLDVVGSIYTPHTLNYLEELGLDTQKAHETAFELHAYSVHYTHKHKRTRTWKKQIAFKALAWSRGLPDPH